MVRVVWLVGRRKLAGNECSAISWSTVIMHNMSPRSLASSVVFLLIASVPHPVLRASGKIMAILKCFRYISEVKSLFLIGKVYGK